MRFPAQLAALLLLLAGALPPAAAFNGQPLSGQGYARDFSLTDHDGVQRTLADFRGKVVLLFFGFLQCPDYCPTTLSRMKQTLKLLGPQADRVQVLFVTLDPERDTPGALKEYVGAFDPSFLGLYASPEATPGLALDFRVYYSKVQDPGPGRYHIDHAVFSYAYDPSGRLRLMLRHDLSARQVAEDVRRLLAEAGSVSP